MSSNGPLPIGPPVEVDKPIPARPLIRRPRLEKLTVQGFKTIRNLIEFEPGSLTVLIGPNGAGKSNFISFFRLLAWMLADPGQLQVHVAEQGGASALLHDGPTVTSQINAVLKLAADRGHNEYGFRLSHAAGDTLLFTGEWFRSQPYGQERKRTNPNTAASSCGGARSVPTGSLVSHKRPMGCCVRWPSSPYCSNPIEIYRTC
jgi:hypothetical protein